MEKIVEICHSISVKSQTENASSEEEQKSPVKKNMKKSLKAKIDALFKMKKMLCTLRDENELIYQLKAMCPDSKIPKGLLLEGRDKIVEAIQAFKKAKCIDRCNEKIPNNNN